MQMYKIPVDPVDYDKQHLYDKYWHMYDKVYASNERFRAEFIDTLENCLNAESQGYHHLEHIQ